MTGFTDNIDFIRINHSTDQADKVVGSASLTTVNGKLSSVVSFHDGSTMKLVGFTPDQIQPDSFK